MSKLKNPFPYYVGVNSLEELANKKTRVLIMNILGNESKTVTPTSHQYSGGNIVAGVQFGQGGSVLETNAGNIPVYGSVKEALDDGKQFDTGVIYLPPSAVNYATAELCKHNHNLKKIVILTEKVSVRDARMMRWGCQEAKVDVFGGNCLGIANPHDRVRVGGALGGDKPAEALVKGSVAIYSNSGNFSTTMSEYLKTGGFGTSTILSSGKDVIIHFALPEFLYCAENDPRTRAVVVYIEPGGYYEKQALDWIQDNRFNFTKPIIACVTGRWKKNITRACGHAGALSGGGDDAEGKEKWFDNYFGVGQFNANKIKVSPRGVRVASIQEIPAAMAAVIKALGQKPDFAPIGDLSLKPWFANQFKANYPKNLSFPVTKAIEPYAEQIERVSRQVGAQLPREGMRNRSGATMMNAQTQVTEMHGKTVLELVEHPFGATNLFALTKEMPSKSQLKLVNLLLNYFVSNATSGGMAATMGRKNGATPNAFIGAEVLMTGDSSLIKAVRANISTLIDLFYPEVGKEVGPNAKAVEKALKSKSKMVESKNSASQAKAAEFMLKSAKTYKASTVFTDYADAYLAKNPKACRISLALAALALSLSWESLTGRRITRDNAEELCTYFHVHGTIVANAPANREKNAHFAALASLIDIKVLETDFSETCFRLLFDRAPKNENEIFALNAMLNLTVSNGPGTISGKGAKESVSAKNQIPVAYAGFMANTGLAHGGNGFEAVAFLIERFKDYNPYKGAKGLDKKIQELAHKAAMDYNVVKKQAKVEGNMQYMKIPCVNHPVFKGKPVNIDPREEFIYKLFKARKMDNPFQEFYHKLVVELFEAGATKNVFCVNIDAVIATISLELFWDQLHQGKVTEAEMQDLVFVMFLFARMVGSAAEIADHRARGTDMDCRTPASQCEFVV
ncbi:MAG: CoA-binding protein [Candidatus Lambdaproteobacteria bacterium RIFOXYD2_FULL_50_16]|uniref:CoA-binding protein n=1 Tax=Candidatus Lambdaproteobacteria bacterium RIFOXYD2_FULL_50_16 TaxID=1817772 RepID=A0A1F6GA65_9PROT|nr:MAG: CoA-binding protein [Candidatus Lambdaproteobacteria bacterium RIFOXYD2_FULL_50_16]